jgi:Leucine-rich repeat (LRR) protein
MWQKMRKVLTITILIGVSAGLVLVSYVFWKFSQIKNTQSYFDNLDEALKKPEQVNVLIIRNQGLTSLSDEIGKLTNLRTLNLANNHLTELPEAIGDLANLEELSFENNQLKQLPSSLKKLKKLRRVNGSNNLLREIPKEIYDLPALRTLNLSNNQITAGDIGALRHLEGLDLSENNLEELMFSTNKFSRIKRLDFYNNKLVTVPKIIFELPLLNELILSGNQLDSNSQSLYKNFLNVKPDTVAKPL